MRRFPPAAMKPFVPSKNSTSVAPKGKTKLTVEDTKFKEFSGRASTGLFNSFAFWDCSGHCPCAGFRSGEQRRSTPPGFRDGPRLGTGVVGIPFLPRPMVVERLLSLNAFVGVKRVTFGDKDLVPFSCCLLLDNRIFWWFLAPPNRVAFQIADRFPR